jgi:peptide deformylase
MPKLVHSSDPILRQQAAPVLSIEDVSQVIADMWEVLNINRGVGLAAPQIGISKRIIIVKVGSTQFCIINPVIVKRWGGKRRSEEGCLSFPGLHKKIPRDRFITVQGLDENLCLMQRKCSNLIAACVQHEVEHLNGITIAAYR